MDKQSPFDALATDVARFTEGDCHYLARAIHERTGWPMMTFSDRFGPCLHAFVLMPDLRALDVEGPCNIRTFKRRWKSTKIAEINWPKLRSAFGPPEFGRYTYARAGIIADRLLDLAEVPCV